jgi:broad specificity phosphatase PhoE
MSIKLPYIVKINLAILTAIIAVTSAHALAPRSIFDKGKKGRVITPLTPAEVKALTPAYKSVKDFMTNLTDWRRTHPHAKLTWLVRHGESYSNVFDLTQDPTSYSPLTSRGREHAKALADFLQDVDFDQIITSSAERAYMTVRELAGRKVLVDQITIESRIQEFSFWPAGGMPLKETQKTFTKLVELFYTAPHRYVAPGKISMMKFKENLGLFFGELARNQKSNILLGTHGMTVVLAVMEALDIPLQKYWAARPYLSFTGYAGITILAYDASRERWELLVYADNSYLPEDLKGKKPLTSDLEAAYYQTALMRLNLKKLGRGNLKLSDFFPTEATFTRPSPEKLRDALSGFAVIESSA